MTFEGERGYDTPEEAALAGCDDRFTTFVGVHVSDDAATVYLLTNDRPPFEPYEVYCVRERGRWHETAGAGGFATDAPPDILTRASQFGWE